MKMGQSVPKRRHINFIRRGKHPKDSIQHSVHGESLKSRWNVFSSISGIPVLIDQVPELCWIHTSLSDGNLAPNSDCYRKGYWKFGLWPPTTEDHITRSQHLAPIHRRPYYEISTSGPHPQKTILRDLHIWPPSTEDQITRSQHLAPNPHIS